MAKQYLNTEKLENKKKMLENHKVNIMDYLNQIKEEYMNLIKKDSWWGTRSDKFFESLKSYWYDFSAPEDAQSTNRGIIGNVETDFNNMIKFIQNAIDLSLGKDVEAAKEIESIEGPSKDNKNSNINSNKTGVAGANKDLEEVDEDKIVDVKQDTKAVTPSNNGKSMNIPSGKTSYKSYTNIDSLRGGTPQSAVARGGQVVPYGKYKGNVYNTQTDLETGVRYVTFDGSDEKYYCVAMGTYYGEVGDTLKITTDEGNSWNVILTDVKGSDAASYGDTSKSYYHPKGNNKCVVEFYIDYPADDIKVYNSGKYIGTTGNYNDCSQFSGNITSVEKLN